MGDQVPEDHHSGGTEPVGYLRHVFEKDPYVLS